MKTCSFITLGCKVNQYETQALREAIISSGYEEASLNVPVDLCVINTCTVTATSDDKSRHQIRKVVRNNPDATVIVTGCYAESDAETIRTIEGVGYVFEKGKEDKIIEFVKNGFVSDNNSVPVSSNIRDPRTKKLRRNESAFDLKVSKFDGPDDLMNEIVDVHVESVLPQSVMGTSNNNKEARNAGKQKNNYHINIYYHFQHFRFAV